MPNEKPIRRNRSTNNDIIQLTYWLTENRERFKEPMTTKSIRKAYRESTGTEVSERLVKTVSDAVGLPLKSPRRSRRRYKGQTARLDRLIIEVVHLAKKINSLHSVIMDIPDSGLSEGLETLYRRKADPNGTPPEEDTVGEGIGDESS